MAVNPGNAWCSNRGLGTGRAIPALGNKPKALIRGLDCSQPLQYPPFSQHPVGQGVTRSRSGSGLLTVQSCKINLYEGVTYHTYRRVIGGFPPILPRVGLAAVRADQGRGDCSPRDSDKASVNAL